MALLKRASYQRDTGNMDDESYQNYLKMARPLTATEEDESEQYEYNPKLVVTDFKVIRETMYLKFTKLERPKDKKTDVILIESQRGEILGFIRWFGRWRQYAFFPEPETIWNTGCMKDVNEVINELMKDRTK